MPKFGYIVITGIYFIYLFYALIHLSSSSVGVVARWWPVAACWSPTSQRKTQDSTPAWPTTASTTALSTPRPCSLCKVQGCFAELHCIWNLKSQWCSCGSLYDQGRYIGCFGEEYFLMDTGPSFNGCFGKGIDRMSLDSFTTTHVRNFRGMQWMTRERSTTFLFRTTIMGSCLM